MSYNCIIDDGWYNPEWWLKCVPRPHLLDVLIQILSVGDGGEGTGDGGEGVGDGGEGVGDGGEGTSVSTSIIEDLLPDLCFSLPHRAQGCVTLLNSLSQKSVVWDKLEEGLIKKKYLPVEVTVAIYTARNTTLEKEVIRVMSLYANNTYNEDWWKKSWFTVTNFMSTLETGSGGSSGGGGGGDGGGGSGDGGNGDGGSGGGGGDNLASNSTHAVLSLINADSSKSAALNLSGKMNSLQTVKSSQNVTSIQKTGSLDNRINHWAESPVIEASVHSSTVFSMCLSLLFKILKDKHSISAVFASSDYFSRAFRIAKYNLFTLFPPHLQHLVYVLTLPLVSGLGDEYFQSDVRVSVVQEALREALRAENGMVMVKAVLCFFPFWLPVLQQRKFLDKYLLDWWCDS
ncbi:hypothetical protein Pmani_035593 [Petrolisthes manimaculis]|uniref:Uncharacterized protein n=1 Tax=Petrolisthes manimaculis TaxID=1843537 RepID=A0AAE1NLB9_9EUCA|nr:hypothetical protein Pmani_035593 [Petrolisthes manimaculis]